MRYMLLIYGDENALNGTLRQECYGKAAQVARDLHVSGQSAEVADFWSQFAPPTAACA